MASSSSPVAFFVVREEDVQNHLKRQQQQQLSFNPSSSSAAPPPAAPQKKKRKLPGTPNPDAEVIALSPKTLLTKNRFICQLCNKGFPREQNLQLHRRGHNLPWKLQQKSTKEVKRRVYLCPEPTCVHHDPSRALGDLTGIKKHYFRKHGEKKWKCDKCSKRYAVQSDWKAHSKTCGTREYRCDCGTLFSRRDSFITHTAFCDALAQESDSHLYRSSSVGIDLSQVNSQIFSLQDQNYLTSSDLLRLGGSGGFNHLIPSSNASSLRPPQAGASSAFFLGGSSQDLRESHSNHSFLQNKSLHGLMQLPDVHNSASTSSSAVASAVFNWFNLSCFSNSGTTSSMNNSNSTGDQNDTHLLISEQFNCSNASAEQASIFRGNLMSDHVGSSVPSLYNTTVQKEPVLPQMSATALLQKAAQMGAATSSSGSCLLRGFRSSSSSTNVKATNFKVGSGIGNDEESIQIQIENETHLKNLMNSLANGSTGIFVGSSGGSAAFGGGLEQDASFGGFQPVTCNMGEAKLHQDLSLGSIGGLNGWTRDFLGVGSAVRRMGGGISHSS